LRKRIGRQPKPTAQSVARRGGSSELVDISRWLDRLPRDRVAHLDHRRNTLRSVIDPVKDKTVSSGISDEPGKYTRHHADRMRPCSSYLKWASAVMEQGRVGVVIDPCPQYRIRGG